MFRLQYLFTQILSLYAIAFVQKGQFAYAITHKCQ